MSTKTKRKRVGLLGIYHESNTFIEQQTTISSFEEGHLFTGAQIMEEYRDAHHEIGGVIEVFEALPIDLFPILYAEATPGGVIEATTAETLIEQLFFELTKILPLDGLMVVPHGAAVSEKIDDFDGHWLSLLRDYLPDIPIVGTLDPHANVSKKMAAATNVLLAYQTNPHLDQRDTGRRAARIMIDILYHKIDPVQHLLQTNIAIGIEAQNTSVEPCKSLYNYASSLMEAEGILEISVLLGFPYADVAEMASGFLIVANRDCKHIPSVLENLAHYFKINHRDFSGEKISVQQAIELIDQKPKPILLLDMGDNVGGGSPGDGTFLLHALEADNKCKSFVCINDPIAVQELFSCEKGQWQRIRIGGKTDGLHGLPLATNVQIKQRLDGKFIETEPRHGGQVHFDMGPTIVVCTEHQTTIMITSKRTVPFSSQQLLFFGISPSDFEVIVAKGVQAPVAAYQSVCPSMIRVNTQGVTTADLQTLIYHKRKKPLFPFESI